MTIEFDKIELDGDAAEALTLLKGNEGFTKYVADSVANREEAVRKSALGEIEPLKKKVDEFRSTNVALKEQLEQFDGFDAKEFKRLKSLGSDANAAAEQMKRQELEYKGIVEGRDAQLAEANATMAKMQSVNEENMFRLEAQAAIHRHNAKYESVAVRPKAEKKLIEEMMASQKIVDGQRVMLDNGKEFTTDAGIGSLDDWINVVGRRELDYMFNSPTGGGAPGSNSSRAGSKQMTRHEFSLISDPIKRSEVARTYTILDS